MQNSKLLALVALVYIVPLTAQQCTDTATGSAWTQLNLTFPGSQTCGAGSTTNALPWKADVTGEARCPYMWRDGPGQGWQWSSSGPNPASMSRTSGAGCWMGLGPAVFTYGTTQGTCPTDGNYACSAQYVTELGQWQGV